MIAREGRMGAGLGWQIWRRRGNRLDTGLLVIGDDRHRVAWLLLGCCRGLLNDLHLPVNAQNLRHLLLEFGIAAFQVVADLVRLHFLLVEYLAHRTLHQLAETGVPFRRSMLRWLQRSTSRSARPGMGKRGAIGRLDRRRRRPGLRTDKPARNSSRFASWSYLAATSRIREAAHGVREINLRRRSPSAPRPLSASALCPQTMRILENLLVRGARRARYSR